MEHQNLLRKVREVKEKMRSYRKSSLESDIAWLTERLNFWTMKEQEYRTKVSPIQVSDVHTYSLVRFAKQKRKKYQRELKEAQEKLASME